MTNFGFTLGQPVEVHQDLGPLGKHWSSGYSFASYEYRTDPPVPFQEPAPTCLVKITDGPFAGNVVRYKLSDVRAAPPDIDLKDAILVEPGESLIDTVKLAREAPEVEK